MSQFYAHRNKEKNTACELCAQPGGALLWQAAEYRVVRVDEPHYPGFCRVIWNAHVREMTDLSPDQRQWLMAAVFAVETVIRQLFAPDKINLACLGNMTPHLHWHIIPRWADDRHFPEPIWGRVHNEQAIARPQIGDDVLARALQRALGSASAVSL
ncbi:MAG: HIT family protein [Azonexus sp.]|jgi:diadenosine tetraphosphate (Ap4A) HIT family hydrolase|nr:HIT family protein [Azonexus sp.]